MKEKIIFSLVLLSLFAIWNFFVPELIVKHFYRQLWEIKNKYKPHQQYIPHKSLPIAIKIVQAFYWLALLWFLYMIWLNDYSIR